MNTPQAVTTRYATNLLNKGENNDFVVAILVRERTMVNNTRIGSHFTVQLNQQVGERMIQTVGATPVIAIENALKELGVTFR